MSLLPLRVLMTADTVGGVWTYALELCAGLGKRGVSVALATMGAPLSPSQWREVRALSSVTVFESRYRLEWMNDPWEDVEQAGAWLLRLDRELQPDLVHLNGYAHAILPFRGPRLVVGHSCVLSWFRAVKGHEAPADWNRYAEAVRAGLHAAARVAAPTHAMLDALRTHYGVTDGAVISNSREPSHYRANEKKPFILAAGRLWDEAKNITTLAQIAPQLSWPVYVAGDATSPDGGTAQLPGVNALGKLAASDLIDWFGRASIYCLPARYEPFGLSALEAALSGCALVLGDIPSLREVWGDCAVFVPPDEPDQLRSSIESLVANPARREHLARLAHERAQTFTPERTVHGYLSVYRQLLEQREASGGVNRCAL